MADYGYLVEGIVELDPITGRYRIRTIDQQGNNIYIDPNDILGSYKGQEVRFTCASFEVIDQLTKMLEGQAEAAGDLPSK